MYCHICNIHVKDTRHLECATHNGNCHFIESNIKDDIKRIKRYQNLTCDNIDKKKNKFIIKHYGAFNQDTLQKFKQHQIKLSSRRIAIEDERLRWPLTPTKNGPKY